MPSPSSPQLAMTHPSHHLNFGMNPDHARNSLSNCGIRQPKYGDRKVHHMYMRKKGEGPSSRSRSRSRSRSLSLSRSRSRSRSRSLSRSLQELVSSYGLQDGDLPGPERYGSSAGLPELRVAAGLLRSKVRRTDRGSTSLSPSSHCRT